jgi:hypothetical protein
VISEVMEWNVVEGKGVSGVYKKILLAFRAHQQFLTLYQYMVGNALQILSFMAFEGRGAGSGR